MNAKISVFTIFTCFALLLAGCSKDDENIPGGIEPPETILDAFNQLYPNASDTEWTVNNDYYVVTFDNNNLDNTVWLNHSGVWSMIESELPLNQLPQAINTSIKQSAYADWNIEEADTIGRAGFGTVYKVEVEKGNQDTDLYYSVYGNFIKSINANGNEDTPIIVPDQVANLMELTFHGSILLDIINQTDGVQLIMLDGSIFKIAELNEAYSWQSTTWQISDSDVPGVVMNGFLQSGYGSDTIESIYVLVDANGTFYKFNVIHNGNAVTVEFDVFGNIVENK